MSAPNDAIAITAGALLAGASALVARALGKLSARRKRIVASFAGGVSIAFVLLELFVELVEGAVEDLHHVFRAGPQPIHTMAVLMLVGTVIAFFASSYAETHKETRVTYRLSIAPRIAYGALVGAALDGQIHESFHAFAVFWIAMSLHLGVTAYHVDEVFPNEHRGLWRGLSIAAPAIGALAWAAGSPPSGMFHFLLALVAGATTLGIWRDEIPDARDVGIVSFFVGLISFSALIQAHWWL